MSSVDDMHGSSSMSKPAIDHVRHSKTRKRTRTRTGCLNCRRKRRKCDESHPACGTCRRRNERCEWGLKITFRDDNAQVIDEAHPSMRIARRRRPREFEILDITDEVIRDYNMPSPVIEFDNEDDMRPDDDDDGEFPV